MKQAVRWSGIVSLGLAGAGLAVLHILPTPRLHATTGAVVSYQPWNFLSEYVRTDYAPIMIACFVFLGLGTLATATMLRYLRREAILLTVAGVSLLLLSLFPTDLADLTTDAVTCGQSTRIEPCTLAGRIHNPISTLVFLPIFLVIASVCVRNFRQPQWRRVTRLSAVCGALALCCLIATPAYLHLFDWQGRLWTGLTQRSLVFPALLWITGLLFLSEDIAPRKA
ncbi:MAG: DUF998 domain-containing protein [Armatimonadota bacterium]